MNIAVVNDPDRIPLLDPPSCLYDQRKMHITAIALTILGSLGGMLAVASFITTAILATVSTMLTLALIATATSAALIGIGILLLRRSYWYDQEYVDQESIRTHTMNFQEVVDLYGWDRINEQHLISNNALKQKFLQFIAGKNYLAVVADHGQQISQNHFFDWRELHKTLEAEAKGMSATQFKAHYGDQPLDDGVIDRNDKWYLDMLHAGIEDIPYHQIVQEYATELRRGFLTNAYLTDVLTRQFDNGCGKSFHKFFNMQGGQSAWQIFVDGIMDPAFFTCAVTTEVGDDKLTIQQLLQRYQWGIFDQGILSGKDFHDTFISEIKSACLSDVIQNYGWKVIDHKLVEPSELQKHALDEIRDKKYTFEQIYQTFGREVFAHQILSGADVRKQVVALCERDNFCHLMDTYGAILAQYNLWPEDAAIPQLMNDKRNAESALGSKVQNAGIDCNRKISNAAKKRDTHIATAKRALRRAEEAIETENKLHRGMLRDLDANQADAAALQSARAFEMARHRHQLSQLNHAEVAAQNELARVTEEQNDIYQADADRFNSEKDVVCSAAQDECTQKKAAINKQFHSLDFRLEGEE